jgi:hypothetical protein
MPGGVGAGLPANAQENANAHTMVRCGRKSNERRKTEGKGKRYLVHCRCWLCWISSSSSSSSSSSRNIISYPIYHPVLPVLVPVRSVCVACLPAYLSAPCCHDLFEKGKREKGKGKREKGKRKSSDHPNPFTQGNVKKNSRPLSLFIFPHPGRSKMIFLGAYL